MSGSSLSDFNNVVSRFVITISKFVEENHEESTFEAMSELHALFHGKESLEEEIRQYISDITNKVEKQLPIRRIKNVVQKNPGAYFGKTLGEMRNQLQILFSDDFNVNDMCKKPCGPKDDPGVQIRAIHCYVKKSSQEKIIVPDAYCTEVQKPQYIRNCVKQKPCKRWRIKELCSDKKIAMTDPICEIENAYQVWTKLNDTSQCENPNTSGKVSSISSSIKKMIKFPKLGIVSFMEMAREPPIVTNQYIRLDTEENDFTYSRHYNTNQGFPQLNLSNLCGIANNGCHAKYTDAKWDVSEWSTCIHKDCLTDFPETPINKILNKVARVKTDYPKKYDKLISMYQQGNDQQRRILIERTNDHFFKGLLNQMEAEGKQATILMDVLMSTETGVDFFLKARKELRNDAQLWRLAYVLYKSSSIDERDKADRSKEITKELSALLEGYGNLMQQAIETFKHVSEIYRKHRNALLQMNLLEENANGFASKTQIYDAKKAGLSLRGNKPWKKILSVFSRKSKNIKKNDEGSKTTGGGVRFEVVLSESINHNLLPGSWTSDNEWIPRSPNDRHFGMSAIRNIHLKGMSSSRKPSLHHNFQNIMCKGYEWRVRSFEPIRNQSCPYHACRSCVKCTTGECVWNPYGQYRGCYNVNNISSILGSRHETFARTLSQCRDCTIHTDLEAKWGRCQGCPSEQKRIVECISKVDLRQVPETHCENMEKPESIRPCVNSPSNTLDEYMYTESEEKKHWQHAWHIVLASSNEDGDSCNAECVRFCDARAFSKSFLPSDSEKHTLSFKVISKDSEEYNLCKRNHRNPGEMLSLNEKKNGWNKWVFYFAIPKSLQIGQRKNRHNCNCAIRYT